MPPTAIPPTLDQFLAQFMVWFFFVFGAMGFAIGVGLILDHIRMHEFFGIMNHWVSMRRSTRWLAIPRNTGLVTQRFRRLIGGVFILVAAYSTFILITQVDISQIVALLHVEPRQSLVGWLIGSMRWFLIGGSMVAIAIGIMLVFFEKALAVIETRANHWYSFRSCSQSGDAMHLGLDRWVESYPRALGAIIAVAALAVVVDYGMRLFARS